jgi:hypothetical protein
MPVADVARAPDDRLAGSAPPGLRRRTSRAGELIDSAVDLLDAQVMPTPQSRRSGVQP